MAVNGASSRMSSAAVPTSTRKAPGSATHACSLISQCSSDCRVRSMATVLVSPGSSHNLANPLSSFGGSCSVESISDRYSCTTSAPRRRPVLVTSTETVSLPPASASSVWLLNRTLLSSKVV